MHKLSRSKHLIVLFNHLGISVSYDELEKEDIDLVQRKLDRTGDHRVPLPPSIKSKIVIHSAVDNFGKSDDKGGSRDTILMFFQNPPQVPSVNLIMCSKPKDVGSHPLSTYGL